MILSLLVIISGKVWLWPNNVEASVKDEVMITKTDYIQPNSGIKYFDVDASENILLGFINHNEDSMAYYIYVFNKNMVFQYGYALKTSGGVDVRLCNEGVMVYIVRKDEVMVISPEGELIDYKNLDDIAVHNRRWIPGEVNSPLYVSGKKYYYENKSNLTTTYYSKAAYEQQNEEVILFEYNDSSLKHSDIWIYIATCIIAGYTVVMYRVRRGKSKREE